MGHTALTTVTLGTRCYCYRRCRRRDLALANVSLRSAAGRNLIFTKNLSGSDRPHEIIYILRSLRATERGCTIQVYTPWRVLARDPGAVLTHLLRGHTLSNIYDSDSDVIFSRLVSLSPVRAPCPSCAYTLLATGFNFARAFLGVAVFRAKTTRYQRDRFPTLCDRIPFPSEIEWRFYL